MTLEKIKNKLMNGEQFGIRKYYDRGHIKAYGIPRLEYNKHNQEYIISDNEQEFTINDDKLSLILQKYNIYKIKGE